MNETPEYAEPTSPAERLYAALREQFQERIGPCSVFRDEVTLEASAQGLREIATQLRDHPAFSFKQLSDLCGVDYLHYGLAEWQTQESTATGFSRGVARDSEHAGPHARPRFAVVYHLLSLERNQRLRLKVFAVGEPPRLPSVIEVWPAADWFEREAFDLYGILFEGHPDLRRILTDYGFIGHPFRKDFPLIGNVEMRYDPDKQRVVYQPVSIEPRVLVPKVIREERAHHEELEKGAEHA